VELVGRLQEGELEGGDLRVEGEDGVEHRLLLVIGSIRTPSTMRF
jgi:hypothetical protein